jgi:hypothetical protein
MAGLEKIVVVTRPSALDELIQRFGTRDQARFYIESMGGAFADYQAAHDADRRARERLGQAIPGGVRVQWIDRSFLPTYQFGPADLVVVLGPDGLVVNTAKYLTGQSVLAINPDPERIDGTLLPFSLEQVGPGIAGYAKGGFATRQVSMARAVLNDGQALLAVNDLFVGARTHVSARYQIRLGEQAESQSSSGIIVSTGAGSTGWFRSILTGASAVAMAYAPSDDVERIRGQFAFKWDSPRLAFSVREPFVSRSSRADCVFGWIEPGATLVVESRMPRNGVIFSDGVEEDFLAFNSGAIATIGLADQALALLVPESGRSRRSRKGDWVNR